MMHLLIKKIVVLGFLILPPLSWPFRALANPECMSSFLDSSAILESAKSGDTATIRSFLEKINNESELRDHAKKFLLVATQQGHIELIDYLFLNAKMNFHYEPMLIKEALKQAVLYDQVTVFQFYLSRVATELQLTEPTLMGELLITAVKEGKIKIVNFYLSQNGLNWTETGLDPNQDSIKRRFLKEAMILTVSQQKNYLLNLFFEKISQIHQYLPISKNISNRDSNMLNLFFEKIPNAYQYLSDSIIRELITSAVLQNKNPLLDRLFKSIPEAHQYLPDNIVTDMVLSQTSQTSLATNPKIFEETLKILPDSVIRESLVSAVLQQKNNLLNRLFKNIPNASQYLPDTIIADMVFSKPGQTSLAKNQKAFVETLKILIQQGFDINKQNKKGDTVLHRLLRNRLGRSMTAEQYTYWRAQPGRYYYNHYYYTATSIIEVFYLLGANLSIRGKNGDTLAHAAAQGGNLHILRELSNRDHSFIVTNNKGETVWDKIKIYKLSELRQRNTVWDEILFGVTTYQQASLKNQYIKITQKYISELIENGKDITDELLIEVISKQALPPKEFKHWLPIMIAHGANPNAKDANGVPVLHILMNNTHSYTIKNEKAKLLFENGGDPNITNQNGDTILHILYSYSITINTTITKDIDSILESIIDSIEFFIANGVDPTITNNNGDTPFDALKKQIQAYKQTPKRNKQDKLDSIEARMQRAKESLEKFEPQSEKDSSRFSSFFRWFQSINF